MPYGVGVRVPLSAPRGGASSEVPFFHARSQHRRVPRSAKKRRKTPESLLFPTGRRKKSPRKPVFQFISLNLYKEYSYLKLRDLEELPCFGVMIWQLCHLLRSAMNCIQITLYNAKVK